MKDTDSLNFITALEKGDRYLMGKVPRADVHNHAALGGDFHSWVEKEQLDLKEGKHNFPDFTDFQNLVDSIFTYPHSDPTNQQRIDRFFSLFAETFELAIADGVTYIEPGYDSILLDLFEMDLDAMISRIKKQINIYSDRITIAPDIGIIRVFDLKDIERTIYPCIESGFFKAIDIFADERVGPPEDFKDIYRTAKRAGMKLKAHAGELLDAEFVRKSVKILDLDEVQHGIAAVQSKEVMSFLAEKGTRLNICPSSNIQLCQVESYKTHPIRTLMDHGVKVTVNTDDAIIFGRSSSDEFFSLYETGLYRAEELDSVRLAGFPGSLKKSEA
jgi:adenosine deaminase